MKVTGKKSFNDKTFHLTYQLNEEVTLSLLKVVLEMQYVASYIY